MRKARAAAGVRTVFIITSQFTDEPQYNNAVTSLCQSPPITRQNSSPNSIEAHLPPTTSCYKWSEYCLGGGAGRQTYRVHLSRGECPSTTTMPLSVR